jgi:hypothetical protein
VSGEQPVPTKKEEPVASLNTITITWDDQDRPEIKVEYSDSQHLEAEATPDEWLPALAQALGDKSANHLRALIQLNATQGAVALVELAADLGVDKNDVDGWNRNLGRTIKRIVRDYGFLRPENEDGTAQLFDFEWDKAGNAWRYVVPEKFRPTLVEALDQR